MADTYWPYIIAQFGLFGTIFYILGLQEIFREAIHCAKVNKDCFIATVSLIVYLIGSSFVESAFTNAPIVLIGLTLGYYIPIQCRIRSE